MVGTMWGGAELGGANGDCGGGEECACERACVENIPGLFENERLEDELLSGE